MSIPAKMAPGASLLRRPAPTSPLAGRASKLLALQFTRQSSRNRIMREHDRQTRENGKRIEAQPTMSKMQHESFKEYFKDGGGPLFPGTFVSLPLTQFPRNPANFAKYLWLSTTSWAKGILSALAFKVNSMPTWTSRPKWKARRWRIPTAAKAQYQEMLEAFAAGDKATLKRVCVADGARKFIAAIDRRNPREGVRFELVKYNKSLFYPKLMSHQIHQANPWDKTMVTEQAVVAIASTQQASKYNVETGATIPGSLKIQDKLEYIVVARQVNKITSEPQAWRIWGTLAPTSLNEHLIDKAAMESEQKKQIGWGK